MPRDLLAKLDQIRPDLEMSDYIDELARRDDVVELLRSLNEICVSRGVVGVHYTRSFRESILRDGLQSKSGQERREQFLREHGQLFTEAELERVKSAYRDYFTAGQNGIRDSMIWFNLTKNAMGNGAAGRLLEHFGGEVVYMPLTRLRGICDKIRKIGEPLVVECRLHPDKLHGFWEYPVALVWLSAYHTHINPRARLYDVDVYSTSAISPDDILRVETAQYWR